jgi:hypothetical protein
MGDQPYAFPQSIIFADEVITGAGLGDQTNSMGVIRGNFSIHPLSSLIQNIYQNFSLFHQQPVTEYNPLYIISIKEMIDLEYEFPIIGWDLPRG